MLFNSWVPQRQIHAVPLHSTASTHDSSPVQGALILICGIKRYHWKGDESDGPEDT